MLIPPAGMATLDFRSVQRLAGFAGFLRANGFAVGGGDGIEVLRTAERVGVLDGRVLRWSLQALLCRRSDEWRRFDELFDAWFLPPNAWQAAAPGSQRSEHPDARAEGGASARHASGAERDAAPRASCLASDREALGSSDFRTLTRREDLLAIEVLMRRFARRLKHVRLRREARAWHGRRLDLAATIRRSVSSGGTPLRLAWRRQRRVRPRLVLLIDVSRSMAPYSFFYLRLARALNAELTDIRSFIFHTHLTAVSEPLREPDPHRAQQRLQVIAQGWAGGTRIGASLAQFNREHAPRCVHSRTAVLIVSDGYDTGEPGQLSTALAALRRRARRIVWLNPLCARPDYTPVSEGMQAALLAEQGVDGPPDVIESRDGFMQAFAFGRIDKARPIALPPEAPFGITDCYIKPYACCRHIQPAVEALYGLLNDEKIATDEIARVDVETYKIAAEHAHTGWDDFASAQLSFPYLMGVAARYRGIKFEHFEEKTRRDPQFAAFAQKLHISAPAEIDQLYPKLRPARVTVTTAKGKFTRQADEALGSRLVPLDDAGLTEKFVGLVAPVLGEACAKELSKRLWAADQIADVTTLVDMTAKPA